MLKNKKEFFVQDLLAPLLASFTMYTAIPLPQIQFTDAHLKKAFVYFPLIGLVLGLGLGLLALLSEALQFSGLLFGAIAFAFLMLLTGFIHVDGLMDTADAVNSHRGRAAELEIMKDPHSGAMAIGAMVTYAVLNVAILSELYWYYGSQFTLEFILVFVASRALSAYSSLTLPKAREEGMLRMFTDTSAQTVTRILLLELALAVLLLCMRRGLKAVISLLAGAAIYFGFTTWTKKRYQGTSGDLQGAFLSLLETVLLFTLCF